LTIYFQQVPRLRTRIEIPSFSIWFVAWRDITRDLSKDRSEIRTRDFRNARHSIRYGTGTTSGAY
jgi:hypothetical protein